MEHLIWILREGRIPCLFHELTGFYCPGCGGTRAVLALLAGHPVLSFLYHPLVPYCALVGPGLCGFLCHILENKRSQVPAVLKRCLCTCGTWDHCR